MDINVTIKFDYNDDIDFVEPDRMPNGMTVSPNPTSMGEAEFFHSCGYIRAWGKHLYGADTSAPGGAGLIGDWLYVRKHVNFVEHVHSPGAYVINELQFNTSLASSPAGDDLNSPLVVAFTIDQMSFIVMFHKKTAAREPVDYIGDNQAYSIYLNGIAIPFPSWGAWGMLKNFRKGMRTPAEAFTIADLEMIFTCTDDLTIGVAVGDLMAYGHDSLYVIRPEDASKTVMSEHLLGIITSGYSSAFGGMVMLAHQLEVDGWIEFDEAPEKMSSTETRDAFNQFNAATFRPPSPEVLPLGLPLAPKGYQWSGNIRGLIYLTKKRGVIEDSFFWPHEVFDLAALLDLEAKIETELMGEVSEQLVNVQGEIAQIRGLFQYMADVAYGIANTNAIFGRD